MRKRLDYIWKYISHSESCIIAAHLYYGSFFMHLQTHCSWKFQNNLYSVWIYSFSFNIRWLAYEKVFFHMGLMMQEYYEYNILIYKESVQVHGYSVHVRPYMTKLLSMSMQAFIVYRDWWNWVRSQNWIQIVLIFSPRLSL